MCRKESGVRSAPGGVRVVSHRERGPFDRGRARRRVPRGDRRRPSTGRGRIRAGVLEQGTVDLMDELGIGARMHAEGLMHGGINLGVRNTRERIDLQALTGGKQVMVYGQTEVTRDLMAARAAVGAKTTSLATDRVNHAPWCRRLPRRTPNPHQASIATGSSSRRRRRALRRSSSRRRGRAGTRSRPRSPRG